MQYFLKCLRKIWITKLDRLLPCNVSGLESGQQPRYFMETAVQKYTGETLFKTITASNFWKYAYLTCLGWKPDPTPVVLDLVNVKKLTYRSNKKWSLYLIKKNLIHIQWGLVYNLLRPVFSESLTQIYWDMWLLAYYIIIYYLYNILIFSNSSLTKPDTVTQHLFGVWNMMQWFCSWLCCSDY